MASTVTLTGRIVLPGDAAPDSAQIRLQLTGTDTDQITREALPAGGQIVIDLDDGDVPAGTVIWRNTSGLAGSSYNIYLTYTDADGRGQSRLLADRRTVGDEDSYDLSDLIDAGVAAAAGTYVRAITAAQYNAAITARDEAQGWSAVSEQAAGQATAGVVALAASTAAGLSATAADDLFAVGVDAAGGDPARLDLYINDAGTARLLLNDYRPNAPLVPLQAPAAPALVTSLQAMKTQGVPLKMALGRSYSSGNDGAGTLNAVLPDIAGAGLTINDPDGTVLRCTGSIRPPTSGLKMELGPKTLITKDFASSGLADALFAQSSFATNTDGLTIQGGVWQALQAGIMFAVWGDDMDLSGMVIRDFSAGQGLMFGGNRVRLNGLRVFTDNPATGTGAIRYHGGEDMRAIGCYAKCGDDALQLVPVGNSSAPRFGTGINNAWYIGCTGVSATARVAVIQLPIWSNPSDTAYAGIRNGGFLGCSGVSPATPVKIVHEKPGGSAIVGTESNRIDGIVISGFRGTGARPDTLTEFEHAILIRDEVSGGIGRLTFRDFELADNNLAIGIKADVASPAEILFDNFQITGEEAAVQIRTGGRFTFRGGNMAIKNNGGLITYPSGSRSPVSVIQTLSGGSSTTVLDDVVLEGIPTNGDGYRATSGHTLRSGGVVANKAAGATSTQALNIVSGGTGSIGAPPTGTVDQPTNFGDGTVSRLYVTTDGLRQGVVTVSEAVNTAYSVSALASFVLEAGAPSVARTKTANVAGWVAGQTMTVRRTSSSAGPITWVKSGGGTLGILTAVGDWFRVVHDGTTLIVTEGEYRTTVANLPSASGATAGLHIVVTDANATTFQSIVAGGGSNAVPVHSDGTNWRIG